MNRAWWDRPVVPSSRTQWGDIVVAALMGLVAGSLLGFGVPYAGWNTAQTLALGVALGVVLGLGVPRALHARRRRRG